MVSPALYRRAVPSGARISKWRAGDGWELRRFDWPATDAPRGSILFQGGRGDFFEKYLEVFAHWHQRGWNIASFDWRGQAGSGRCTESRDCGHIDRFDLYLDDFAGFTADWRAANPGLHVVMGHSMGGHLVLRALVEGRIAADAAVLVAPMLGLKGPISAAFAERLAIFLARLGRPTRPAWKGNERPHSLRSRQSLLTHDSSRYGDELWWQTANPELLTGPPSWHWLTQAFASTRHLRDNPEISRVRTPVLALIADADGLVDARASAALVARLPNHELVHFGPEAAHELLRERDPVRSRALAAIDSFLDQRAPAS